MTDPAKRRTPLEELRQDRRHESWLLVKGVVALLLVVIIVLLRQRYWL